MAVWKNWIESKWRIAAIAAWLGYGVFIAVHFAPVAGGSDSSGYMNSAALLLRGQLLDEQRPIPGLQAASPYVQVPLGFAPRDGSNVLVPTYPFGMPLQFALAKLVFGRVGGIYAVGVLGAMVGVLLCYGVAREFGLSRALAWASAAMLALNPVYVFIAVQPLSDLLATTWGLAAVYGVLRSRRGVAWAVFGGAAAAMSVLVRPTNLLLFPALLVLLPSWRALILFALAGLPGALWLAFYQHVLYGSATRSGYGDIWALFRWSNLEPTAVHYWRWLSRFIPWVLLVSGIGLLRCWKAQWRTAAALVLWAAPVLGFYLFYDVTQETWWCLRFVLPAIPAIIIGGWLGLDCLGRALTGRARTAQRLVLVSLAVWAGWLAFRWGKALDVTQSSHTEPPFRDTAQWAGANLPEHAAVACMFASGSVFYYTDLAVLRYDCITPEEFAKFSAGIDVEAQPVFALLFFEEEQEALQRRMPGRWEKVHQNNRAAVWRLVGPTPDPATPGSASGVSMEPGGA